LRDGHLLEHGCAQAGDIYELIKDATPLTPVIAYKNTENRRRHFEKVLLAAIEKLTCLRTLSRDMSR